MQRPRLRTLTISAILVAACGDDGVTATDSDGQTGTTGPTTGQASTTTGVTPTGPEPTTTTSGGTDDASTGSTGSSTGTTEAVSATDTSGTTVDETGDTTAGDSTTGTSSTTGTDTGTGSTTDTGGTTDGSSSSGDDSSSGGESSSTGDESGGPLEEGFGYAGMSNNDSLVIFDPATKMVVGAPQSLLPEADYPYDATIKPDGAEVWIVGASGDGVKVVDTATGQLVQQIDLTGVGDYPIDVLFSADGARAYVSSRDSEALVLIDAATYAVDKTIPLPAPMWGGKMALDPCTGVVHFVDWYDKNLLRFDPMTEAVTTMPLGDSLWDLKIEPTGTTMYVTDRDLDVVHVLDVATLAVQAAVPVGADPWGIDVTSDGSLVVVACEDDATVHFIETAGLTTTSLALPAGADPRDVDISLDDARAYVPSGDVPGNDGVFEIDLATKTLTGLIDFGVNTNTNIVAVTPQPVTCDG